MERESRSTEYKRKASNLRKIAQTTVAFANGSGGRIVIGVEDRTRTVVGLGPEEVDELLERLPVSLADQIQPPLFPQVYERTIDDREVVVVQVFPGGQKPYFIATEGVEKGVYIRVGAHTRRAEGDILEELRLQRSHLSYDEAPIPDCPLADLNRSVLPSSLRSDRALLSLDILRHDPFSGGLQPTRGGILMLHTQPQRHVPEAYVVVSKMRGDSGRDTVESQDVVGNLPAQVEHAVEILHQWLGRNPTLTGARYQNTTSSLPMAVVREAVSNALFHRQYSIHGPTKIALYADRLEVFSPGHFAGPFVAEDLGDGTSYIRNRVVCVVARRLGLIEKRGTGIRLMIDSMRAAGRPEPLFEEGANWFKVTLRTSRQTAVNAPDAILGLLETKPVLTSGDVCAALGVSKATAVARIQELVKAGKLVRQGRGPQTRYRTTGV